MSITKPAIVTKSDFTVSDLPIANKVTASDVNELHRAVDDTIDYVLDLGAAPSAYGGFYTCEGEGTQNVTPLAKIVINQWQSAAPDNQFGAEDGDQTLTVPLDGTYDLNAIMSYETTARGKEIYKIRAMRNGVAIPGACTRVQMQHVIGNTYSAALGRLVYLEAGDVISIEVEGFDIGETRTFDLKHGSFRLFRQINGVTP